MAKLELFEILRLFVRFLFPKNNGGYPSISSLEHKLDESCRNQYGVNINHSRLKHKAVEEFTNLHGNIKL